MNTKALDLYLYMGSYDIIIKWLESEGVKTREEAIQKLKPLVSANQRSVFMYIGMGKGSQVSLAGTASAVKKVLDHFEEKEN